MEFENEISDIDISPKLVTCLETCKVSKRWNVALSSFALADTANIIRPENQMYSKTGLIALCQT